MVQVEETVVVHGDLSEVAEGGPGEGVRAGDFGTDVVVVALGEDAGPDQPLGGVRDDLSVLGEFGRCYGKASFRQAVSHVDCGRGGTRQQGRRG